MKQLRFPARLICPGRIIKKELHARGIHPYGFAVQIDCSHWELCELLSGKRPIGKQMAVNLSRVFGTSVSLWLNLEAAYRAGLAANAKPDNIVRDSRGRPMPENWGWPEEEGSDND